MAMLVYQRVVMLFWSSMFHLRVPKSGYQQMAWHGLIKTGSPLDNEPYPLLIVPMETSPFTDEFRIYCPVNWHRCGQGNHGFSKSFHGFSRSMSVCKMANAHFGHGEFPAAPNEGLEVPEARSERQPGGANIAGKPTKKMEVWMGNFRVPPRYGH